MKTIRYLSTGLLLLTGSVHVAQLIGATLDAGAIITVLFGIAYLIISVFLIQGGQVVLYFGAIVPFIGLLLATVGLLVAPTLLGVFFIAIDLIVVACCIYLIVVGRRSRLQAR